LRIRERSCSPVVLLASLMAISCCLDDCLLC
jgi:hypothetical protein